MDISAITNTSNQWLQTAQTVTLKKQFEKKVLNVMESG